MFKKLLALFTFSVALVQPIYADEVNDFFNELSKMVEVAVTKHKQGEKEFFLEMEKTFKALLEKSDTSELWILASHSALSDLYIKTQQFKRAKPHLEYLIEFHKKNGKKDADLTDAYLGLSFAFRDEGNEIKAKHYAGLACDNGKQLGCELYRELNK